tara:strand:+ start:301 stop:579 length:279 start_codon:yes stop_codon:yes gene_type:complete
MKVEAIPFAKFFSDKKNTIYKNVMIVSKRARQIMDERYMKFESLKNIEDTEQLIEIEEEDIAKPKSISIAMSELMNKDLECSDLEENTKDVE